MNVSLIECGKKLSQPIWACERIMDLSLNCVFRMVLVTLLFCSGIQKSESAFRISQKPSNPTIVVLGVNSSRVTLVWRYSDAPSQYFVQFWRQKTGEKITQISSSRDGNAFNPSNTNEFDASLEATLTLKNVERNEEYTYSIILLDSGARQVETHAVSINVVVPPGITDPPEPKPLLAIRENHTLTCNASGDPLPNISWTKDGIPVDRFYVTGYQLYLLDVKLEDVGSYRCTASNGYGDNATSVSIVGIRCNDCLIRSVGIALQSEVWTSAFNNRESISSVYTKNPGKQLYTVGLVDFRSGSVVAEVELKFEKSVLDPLKPLEDEIKDGRLGSFTVSRELDLNPTSVPFTNFTATAGPFTNVTSTAVPLTSSAASGADQSDDRKKQTMLHAIYSITIFLLLVIIIVLVFVIWRGKNRQGPSTENASCRYHHGNATDNQDQGNPVQASEAYVNISGNEETLVIQSSPSRNAVPSRRHQMNSEYMSIKRITTKFKKWEVKRENVQISRVIGKGAFCQVAKATVSDINGIKGATTVAVKMLKENAPDNDRKDLLSELDLMKKLRPHPHVIKLMGCVTKTDPLLVLIEYIPYGDLLGYLRKSRGLNDTYFKDPDVKPETNLTSEQLMQFSLQIADGMNFLSANKIIHRDLAARNVLVGEGEKCKVTDFGMARNVNQDDIYNKTSRGRLPVKWTAYEGLVYGKYTTQSDVWSFGVVLYEIFTVGGSPYPAINAREIAEKLQQGYRMPKPKHVDEQLYQIMAQCWQENPNDRPTFPSLKDIITRMSKNKNDTYINMREYDTNLYANVDDLPME
ncbi:fibroblast growth factor receptor 2 isoform X3 [Pocillopora verrucosa]|uniref:fibroblast growth factor receptor 2 isoform X3 n=1 Tax=Pocillopora verrucosa TaxID=203993 RepID=UPI003341C1D7